MAISIPSLVKMTRSPRSFIGGKEESFLLVAKVLDLSATKTILQRYNYGLRTTAGSHFQDWDETRVFSHPTVASSRRCVVEGFYVVWKGGLRIRHKGMKKQSRVRKLRNSCCLTLERQTNARLEQLQVLMNSDQRKMHR